MSNALHDFVRHFNSVTDACVNFCCMSRGREFQESSIDDIEKLLTEIALMKDKAIGLGDEDLANLFLSLEEAAKAPQSELRMWISLKDDLPDEAWGHLVQAQLHAQFSMVAHDEGGHLEIYANRLKKLEDVLFPGQSFNSIGYLVKKSRCTICQLDYETCEHIKGKPYMGEFCVREILEGKLIEVSLVKNPANRNCRVTAISDSDGNMRNVMTWREVGKRAEREVTLELDEATRNLDVE